MMQKDNNLICNHALSIAWTKVYFLSEQHSSNVFLVKKLFIQYVNNLDTHFNLLIAHRKSHIKFLKNLELHLPTLA